MQLVFHVPDSSFPGTLCDNQRQLATIGKYFTDETKFEKQGAAGLT